MPPAPFKTVLNPLAALLIFVLGGAASARAETLIEPPVVASVNGLVDILMIAQPQTINSFNISGFKPTGWVYAVCPRPPSGLTCPADAKTIGPYGGVHLALNPGDRLKIRLVNNLPPMQPQDVERIGDDGLLPLNPTNLHTHGLIVAPSTDGAPASEIPIYGDFIFTSIFNPANGDPATYDSASYKMLRMHGDIVKNGVADYDIQIPANHPAGAFWFHPHMHGIALNQLSAGLSGIITIGKAGSYACGDAACYHPVPEEKVRYFVLKDMQVLSGNVAQFQEDTAFCANQPSNAPIGNGVCAGDPAAYAGGNWFFTLNGQQYPDVPISSPDGELWRFTNASGSASYDLQLVDDKTGQPMAMQVISIDGVAVSFAGGAPAGQIVQVGANRLKLVDCGRLKQIYASAPVCATDLIMTPATRVEVHVAYRDSKNGLSAAPAGQTATLRTAGVDTGPGGDSWPAVNLAHVAFPQGFPSRHLEAVHVAQRTDIFDAPVPGAAPAPLPTGCRAVAHGHRRRIYFGNPNVPGGAGPGEDAHGNAIFGLGYEEIDQFGNPVPGTFVDVARFDPAQVICLPLAPGQRPATETWELVNLTTELHNFHIHQTKFRVVDRSAPLSEWPQIGVGQPGLAEDTVPLPFAVPGPGSQPALNPDATSCLVSDFKAGRCKTTPILVQIPFAKLGAFVFHCHILEHEDGGMMHSIRVVPSPM